MITVVVSGLITNSSSEVLMAKRFHSSVLPDQWEIPGGKVEEGETERTALVREMKEELGVDVHVGNLVSVASFTRNVRIHLLLFECLVAKDQIPEPLESNGLRWIDPGVASDRIPCCPSLHAWLPDICDLLDSGLFVSSGSEIQKLRRGTLI